MTQPSTPQLGVWIDFTLIKLLRKKSTDYMVVIDITQKDTYTEIRSDMIKN